VTIILSTAPRYYVMVLPFLLLGFLLMLRKLGEWLGGGWCDFALLLGFGAVIGLNIAKIVPFVLEQQWIPIYKPDFRFYDGYKHGKMLSVVHLADLVRMKVPPGVNVITPSAQIVRYLSEREVLMERELLPQKKSIKHYPEHLATLNIQYAAFPWRVYQDKEPMLANLVKHGVIVMGKRVGTADGIKLARASIQVRPGDWMKMSAPGPTTKSTTKPSTKKAKATTHPSTTKSKAAIAKQRAEAKARADARAAKERKLKAQAATQPTTRKKKKKPPTTAPIVSPATARSTGSAIRQ
jgi:hypothetical protein